MMQDVNDFLTLIDAHFGGSQWFVFLLLGTGLFFTIYLRFPQVRFFKHALKVVSGRYDHHQGVGDTSHFQALATALSGTARDIRQVPLADKAVVIGSEGQGICQELLNASRQQIVIPMSARCESLNAAVAAALVLWRMRYE